MSEPANDTVIPGKKRKETAVDEVDTAPIRQLVKTAKVGLGKIWEPPVAILETLRTNKIADTPSADEIAEMESQLDPIYSIVQPDITKTWSKDYAKI